MDAELKFVAEKIVRDAPTEGINLDDPANAFTVWTEFPSGFMKHCGSRLTFDDAYAWARKHVNQELLYVVAGRPHALNIAALETHMSLQGGL